MMNLSRWKVILVVLATVLGALFTAGDLAGIDATLAAWGPGLDASPEVVAARAELERRRRAP